MDGWVIVLISVGFGYALAVIEYFLKRYMRKREIKHWKVKRSAKELKE